MNNHETVVLKLHPIEFDGQYMIPALFRNDQHGMIGLLQFKIRRFSQ